MIAEAAALQPRKRLRVRVDSHSIAALDHAVTEGLRTMAHAANAPDTSREQGSTSDDADPALRRSDDIAPWWRRGLVGALLDLFSSVKLGIWLMALLFIYSSIGSAGIVYPETWNIFKAENWAHDQIRQWRGLEMTEFEWFHWWPFDLMMILLSINLVVTTLRRIPFKPINYGVWMIHSGIIVLIIGSLIYFGTKVEGDTPIARRKVVARYEAVGADGAKRMETIEFLATPGVRVERGSGAERVLFEVTSIDPAWELLTGDAKGERAYSVNVAVDKGGKRFVRQILAGYPELTEDLIFTADPQQPLKRAVRETGSAIYDDSISLELDYEPQQWFYLRNELVKSWALYVRKPGDTQWVERPIRGMPMYNDYVAEPSMVFQSAGDTVLPRSGLDIAVPAESPDDPFADVVFEVSGYLRYALPRSRFVEGDAAASRNAVAFVTVASEGEQRADYRLVAADPERASADGGLLRFASITDESQFAAFTAQPTIELRIPSQGVVVREEIKEVASSNPDAPFVEIKGTERDGKAAYAYRVITVRDRLPVAGREVSLAILELRTPKGLFRRWVFDDASLTRDVVEPDGSDAHGPPVFVDDSIEATYTAGNGLSLVAIVHGPEAGRMRLVSSIGQETRITDIRERETTPLAGGITVRVEDLMERAVLEEKPLVVPIEQRERDAMEIFSMIRLAAPGREPAWIPFTRWAFESRERSIRRAPYEPRIVRLGDGREVEVLFSRQRISLGTEIGLEEFRLTSHVGGFTGAQGSIRDYMSRVRFRDSAEGGVQEGWSEAESVSMNAPILHNRLWFFQAQWDPPDTNAPEGQRPSLGLNYTVLGVGNRNGVYTQLLGCCIAVAGMVYAFYVKPVLKRRRQEEVLAALARSKSGAASGASKEGKAS
jgi:hypothetical protein